MPSARTPFSPAPVTTSAQNLRTLDQFEDRKELLYALHDAIAQHEHQWTTSGVLHGNINPNSIRIGDLRGPPGARGILVDNHQTHSAMPYLAFQSVMSMARAMPGRVGAVPLDYVDDLESFYYVLAYICTVFSGPHTQLSPFVIPSSIKHIWSLSEDGSLSSEMFKVSFLEKEEKLLGFGVGSCYVTPYFASHGIIHSLLGDLQCVLKYRYLRKVGGGRVDIRPLDLHPEDQRALLMEEAKDDYCRFRGSIEYAIRLLNHYC